MPEEIIKEYLKYPLTEGEMRKEAEKMAYCLSKRAELEGDLKSIKKQLESDIAKVDAELTSAVTKYQSGFEMRNIECRIDKDFQTNTIRTVRLDTFELVRERAMTSEERQESLFDKKAPIDLASVLPDPTSYMKEEDLPDADAKGYMKERKDRVD